MSYTIHMEITTNHGFDGIEAGSPQQAFIEALGRLNLGATHKQRMLGVGTAYVYDENGNKEVIRWSDDD